MAPRREPPQPAPQEPAQPWSDDRAQRFLIVAPVGRDAALAREIVQRAGFSAQICADIDHLVRELAGGAGGVLLTQEALVPSATERLCAVLAAQPPWSDLPVVVLVSGAGATAVNALLEARLNVAILARPAPARLLVNAVGMALRARQRQYDLREHLQARVAAEEAERRARAEAEAAVRIRDEFLAAVAHDLKGPLSAIKGYAQLLKRRVARAGTPETEALAEGFTTIDDMVGKAAAQIDELLDLARLRAGQSLTLDRSSTNMVALATRVARTYQQTTTQHRIHVESAATDVVGLWDTVRLERVLGNLLSNAIKYSPAGGTIVVMVGREAPAPDSRDAATGDTEQTHNVEAWAVVAVRDQGIGIPLAELPHIFERFYRASNVSARIPGTGLGLAGVRQIVAQHGGTITATAAEGGGSTFTIRLPIVSPE